MHEDWLPVARLLRPQGRRGELLADLLAEPSVFTSGHTLWLVAAEGDHPAPGSARDLEAAWQPTGRNAAKIVIKLRGTETISDAEALAGQYLLMRASDLPPLDPDTFRVRDLVGCSLMDGEQLAGTITDVQFPVAADGRTRLTDAPDLLVVQTVVTASGVPADPEPALIPFVRAWLVSVDLPAKRITMQLPRGLFETLAEG